jgi:hypothetical protein
MHEPPGLLALQYKFFVLKRRKKLNLSLLYKYLQKFFLRLTNNRFQRDFGNIPTEKQNLALEQSSMLEEPQDLFALY